MADYSKLINSINEMNKIPLPMPNIKSLPDMQEPFLASAYYDRLKSYIIDFERDLKSDEEVGLKLVTFGESITIHVESIGFYNPRLITFSGRTSDDQEVQLIQHVNQLSILLIKVNRIDPERPRIGYKLQHAEKTSNESEV